MYVCRQIIWLAEVPTVIVVVVDAVVIVIIILISVEMSSSSLAYYYYDYCWCSYCCYCFLTVPNCCCSLTESYAWHSHALSHTYLRIYLLAIHTQKKEGKAERKAKRQQYAKLNKMTRRKSANNNSKQ